MPGFNINGQGSGPSSTIETARQHRWKFSVLSPIKNILLYAHKSGRPSPEFDKIVMHHGQDQINFPGKNKWPPIDISFYQVLGKDDVAGTIYDWWRMTIIDISNSSVVGNKETCELQLLYGANLGGVDTVAYTYRMFGCYISKVTPDALDYSSSAISEITFTLEIDKVIEIRGNSEAPLVSGPEFEKQQRDKQAQAEKEKRDADRIAQEIFGGNAGGNGGGSAWGNTPRTKQGGGIW